MIYRIGKYLHLYGIIHFSGRNKANRKLQIHERIDMYLKVYKIPTSKKSSFSQNCFVKGTHTRMRIFWLLF